MLTFNLLLVIGAVYSGKAADQGCRDILQGYLSGQQSSPIGVYQADALEKRLKASMETLRGSVQKELKKSEDNVKNYLRDFSRNRGNIITYVRWGRNTCPSHADLVYSGWVGGSHYTHSGAAAEPLCLPPDPEWGHHFDGNDGNNAYIYGAEYELHHLQDSRKHVSDHDVPCAVCKRRGKSTVIMIPAKKTCHKGWSLEYTGYLMAGYHAHKAATKYTCIDALPDKIHGGHANHDGKLFYKVEGQCGSLKCPPYVNGREITCAVCSI